MYNDYYLQQIDAKLQTLNTSVNTLNNDLATITTNQATINNTIKNTGVMITMVISVILIYKFIERCFR